MSESIDRTIIKYIDRLIVPYKEWTNLIGRSYYKKLQIKQTG